MGTFSGVFYREVVIAVQLNARFAENHRTGYACFGIPG